MDGGLIFVLTPNSAKQQTHIRPIVAGLALVGNADVVRRAHEFDVAAASHAMTGLAVRHMPVDVVRNLLMAQFH